jgi:hypothetical protein
MILIPLFEDEITLIAFKDNDCDLSAHLVIPVVNYA